jgi:thymidylate synthase ThyX
MANIEARIVGDSVNPAGVRLTSFILKYPRFIHAEFMTHRCFSRNAASSRAIPLGKMMDAVRLYPAGFEFWGSNKPGMQAGEELPRDDIYQCGGVMNELRRASLAAAEKLGHLGLHKQNANRCLELFSHITVLCTGTQSGYGNFFALRAHPAAQPEFQVLAYRMLARYTENTPQELNWGDWHLPKFEGMDDYMGYASWEVILKIATARCARLSYLTFDGAHDSNKDIELHDSLVANGHWSPFEHCAQATEGHAYPWSNFDNPRVTDGPGGLGIGGLSHWFQYRKQFENEQQKPDLHARLLEKPDRIDIRP